MISVRESETLSAKIGGVVDVQNGIDNTISGPATDFQIDPSVAAPNGLHSY